MEVGVLGDPRSCVLGVKGYRPGVLRPGTGDVGVPGDGPDEDRGFLRTGPGLRRRGGVGVTVTAAGAAGRQVTPPEVPIATPGLVPACGVSVPSPTSPSTPT